MAAVLLDLGNLLTALEVLLLAGEVAVHVRPSLGLSRAR